MSDLVAGRARLALQQSIQASTQLHIDAAELCSRSWSFRFKRAAGRAWTAEDPWWDGRAARTLQFSSDGTVAWATGSFDWVPPMRWALEEAPVSGGSGGRRSRRGRNGKGVGESRQTLLRITAEDTQQGSFPGHLLIRHSRWGYVFHSPWAVYASFPLHIASDDSSLLDRRLDKLVEEWQWDEVHAYNGAEDSGDGNDG